MLDLSDVHGLMCWITIAGWGAVVMFANFVKRLPVEGQETFAPVVIREMGKAGAVAWHALIQPEVKQLRRVDENWHWPAIYASHFFLERMWQRASRNVSLYQLLVPGHRNRAIPAASMLLSEGYPFLPHGRVDSVFLWYVASAPPSVLQRLGFAPRLRMTLLAMLDTAIQRSHELGYEGRVSLHAAPAGGVKLFQLYRDMARMRQIAPKYAFSGVTRNNDGRYFAVDSHLAQVLCHSLDFLR